ncbi:hypothetical protein [Piscinibacter terrae]|nr:hypothetical protein [Albitalea terrae]
MNLKVLVAAPVVAFLVMANAAEMKRPEGWSWTAQSSSEAHNVYDMGLDEQVLYQGQRSLTLRGTNQTDISYSAAMQYVSSKGYQGKKVRFSGMLRTSGIDNWAGIWVRSDSVGHDVFSGDIPPPGMGSTQALSQWTPVSVVVLVGPQDSQIAMGLGLVGNGQAWLSDLKFEMVDDTVPVTTTRPAIDLAKYKKWVSQRQARAFEGPDRALPHNLELKTE